MNNQKEFTVKVEDKALSKALQEVAFESGYAWNNWFSGDNSAEIKHLNSDIYVFYRDQKYIYKDAIMRDAHYTLPQDWDKVVELIKKYNEVEFKKGDYIVDDIGKVGRVEKVTGHVVTIRNLAGDSCKSLGNKALRIENKEEIEDALIKEAKRRGFKKGATASNTNLGYMNSGKRFRNGHFEYIEYDDKLAMDYLYIYEKGKWAEIIEDKLEIAGYDVTIDPNDIQIGCKYIDKKKFNNFIDVFCDIGYNDLRHALDGYSEVQLLKQLSKIQEKL